jgi:hypothetical protein
MGHEAVETIGKLNGIPETWFRSLADASTAFPVGSPVVAQTMAPVLFRSLVKAEISVSELFDSQPNDEQLHRLTVMGNQQHDKFGVSHRVKPSELSNRWEMDINYFSEIVWGSVEWLREGKAELGNLTQEFDKLLKNPEKKEKLGLVLRVLYKAADSTNSPESRIAAERHKFLLVNDIDYRKVQCANVALSPVYKNMRQAAEEEALKIEQRKGIKIPDTITEWFDNGDVPKGLQRFA